MKTRDRIYEILRHNGRFPDETRKHVTNALGMDVNESYANSYGHPSDYTVLCLLALLESIEDMETRMTVSADQVNQLKDLHKSLTEDQEKGNVRSVVKVILRLIEILVAAPRRPAPVAD